MPFPDAGAPEIITFSGASPRAGAAPSAARQRRPSPLGLGLGAMEAADAETAGEEEAARGRKEGNGERRWGAPRRRWGPGAARGGGVVAVEEADRKSVV